MKGLAEKRADRLTFVTRAREIKRANRKKTKAQRKARRKNR